MTPLSRHRDGRHIIVAEPFRNVEPKNKSNSFRYDLDVKKVHFPQNVGTLYMARRKMKSIRKPQTFKKFSQTLGTIKRLVRPIFTQNWLAFPVVNFVVMS